jgi:hypothetical protein
MSLHFLSWAYDAPVETPSQLAVLLVAAGLADQDGNLSISRYKLAEKTRVRTDRLDQVIDSLQELGLISIFDPHDWNKIGLCLKAGEQ